MTHLLLEVIQFLWLPIVLNGTFNIFYELKRRFYFLHYDQPFDGGYPFFDGWRILGESTTWGGLIIALIVGLTVQILLPSQFGLLKAMTTYFGHALGSFIKRRLKLPRGTYVPVIDHGDYVILTGATLYFFHLEKLSVILLGLILVLLFQPLVCYTSYKIGWRDNPL
jgi:CDP-2,3-bis-(O-geranylgeranyl)-sn-glycerol synthase